MSLEESLDKDEFNVAHALALIRMAKDVAFNTGHKEKEKKYKELEVELEVLADTYKLTDVLILGACEDLDCKELTNEEILERADKVGIEKFDDFY
jgi:hypothetical protein